MSRVFREPGVFYWPPPIVRSCAALRCPRGQKCKPQKTVTRFVWAICFKWFYPVGIKRLCVKDELNCQCKPRCKRFICFRPRRFNPRTCNCDCSITCRPPFILDRRSCQCKCRRPIFCRKPRVFNTNKCRCECPVRPFCKQRNPVTCRCLA